MQVKDRQIVPQTLSKVLNLFSSEELWQLSKQSNEAIEMFDALAGTNFSLQVAQWKIHSFDCFQIVLSYLERE